MPMMQAKISVVGSGIIVTATGTMAMPLGEKNVAEGVSTD
jgi:hypothetical protein